MRKRVTGIGTDQMNAEKGSSCIENKSRPERKGPMNALEKRVLKKLEGKTSLVRQVSEKTLQLLNKNKTEQTRKSQNLRKQYSQSTGTRSKEDKLKSKDNIRKVDSQIAANSHIDSLTANPDHDPNAISSIASKNKEKEDKKKELLTRSSFKIRPESKKVIRNKFETIFEESEHEEPVFNEEIPMSTYMDYINVLWGFGMDKPDQEAEVLTSIRGNANTSNVMHAASDLYRDETKGCHKVEELDDQNECYITKETLAGVIGLGPNGCGGPITLKGRKMADILTDDRLDYIEAFDFLPEEVSEELICMRKRGRGSLEPRRVPRLPIKASIERMRIVDESTGIGRPGDVRGRARILQERTKANRPHGLHKRKVERRVVEKREVTEKSPAVEVRVDKERHTYNNHWHQDDFPSLGTEPKINPPPRNRSEEVSNGVQQNRTIDIEEDQEQQNEDIHNTFDSDTKGHYPELEVNHIEEKEIVVLKKVKKKKFDFSKANQELLQEFPILNQPRPKILSLTQQNIEKFLRESDTESCSSQENTHLSNISSQEENESVPMYEKYAVTLDDIRKSKASNVPPKVKGNLAQLLEAMDTYCENPNAYFENSNDNSKNTNNHTDANERSITPDGNLVLIENKKIEHCNSVSKTSGDGGKPDISTNTPPCDTAALPDISMNIPPCDTAALPDISMNIPPCDTADDFLSNVSVVSDLSSLNSPTENEFENSNDKLNDDSVEITDDKAEEKELKDIHSDKEHSPSDKSMWRIYGRNAIQVDGLPNNCDISELQGMVAGFGTVVDYQTRNIDSCTSVRFKYHSVDSCEYAVQCLDGTDCLFPESNCKLTCHQLQL